MTASRKKERVMTTDYKEMDSEKREHTGRVWHRTGIVGDDNK